MQTRGVACLTVAGACALALGVVVSIGSLDSHSEEGSSGHALEESPGVGVAALEMLCWLGYPSAKYPRNGGGESWSYTGPENPTEEDREAFVGAIRSDQPLPEGYSRGGWGGRLEYIETSGRPGLWDERVWAITITDEPEDLTSAMIYRNGSLQQVATRSNGGIVEEGEHAVASLGFRARAGAGPVTMEVAWIGTDGARNSSERSFWP